MKYIVIGLIVYLFVGVTTTCRSQEYKTDSVKLTYYKLAQKEFIVLIDSFVLHETEREYYSDSLLFSIRIFKDDDSSNLYFIVIESFYDMGSIINLHPEGFTIYKNHFIFIYGEIPNELFSLSSKPKEEFIIKEEIYTTLVIRKEDDIFTLRTYSFDGLRFNTIGLQRTNE